MNDKIKIDKVIKILVLGVFLLSLTSNFGGY